ncbi:hypothetical protein [Nocardia fusca]|uniref:hypothetical protein n=1 Tax=Nocardia fusca TaxID=941183 RepID=UPI0007A755A8|nr:hypothetical protein [Nocardia fusca]
MPSTYPSPAPLRGCVVGTTTGILAVAAHGIAGGGYPTSAGAALLLLTALVTGAAAGSVIGGSGRLPAGPGRGTLIALAAGQFAGHWALTGLTGHHGTPAEPAPEALPGAAMIAFHLLAVVVCALAITAAERLYRCASSVLRALLEPPHPTPGPPRVRIAATTSVTAHRSPKGTPGPRAPPPRTAPAIPSLGEKASTTCPTGSPPSCAVV